MIPTLLLYRQWPQCRRFHKCLNRDIWVWGWREGRSLVVSLILYLHQVIRWSEWRASVSTSYPLLSESHNQLSWAGRFFCHKQWIFHSEVSSQAVKMKVRNNERSAVVSSADPWLAGSEPALQSPRLTLPPSQYPPFSVWGHACSGWNFSRGMRECFMDFSTFLTLAK